MNTGYGLRLSFSPLPLYNYIKNRGAYLVRLSNLTSIVECLALRSEPHFRVSFFISSLSTIGELLVI